MGLGIYYKDMCVWQSSYSIFGEFREMLILVSGRDVSEIDYDEYKLQGMWIECPEEPLDILFAHSDCDGFIMPWLGAKLADRLEKLLTDISDDWHEATWGLINGLKQASEDFALLEFA